MENYLNTIEPLASFLRWNRPHVFVTWLHLEHKLGPFTVETQAFDSLVLLVCCDSPVQSAMLDYRIYFYVYSSNQMVKLTDVFRQFSATIKANASPQSPKEIFWGLGLPGPLLTNSICWVCFSCSSSILEFSNTAMCLSFSWYYYQRYEDLKSKQNELLRTTALRQDETEATVRSPPWIYSSQVFAAAKCACFSVCVFMCVAMII